VHVRATWRKSETKRDLRAWTGRARVAVGVQHRNASLCLRDVRGACGGPARQNKKGPARPHTRLVDRNGDTLWDVRASAGTERGVVGRSVNVADVSLSVCPILSPPRKSIEEEDGIWQRMGWLVLVRFGQAN
jgi:hypothetical protein